MNELYKTVTVKFNEISNQSFKLTHWYQCIQF